MVKNMNRKQSENPGLLRPEEADTFVRRLLTGAAKLDEIGDFDSDLDIMKNVKIDRILQAVPGRPVRKRRGRLRTFQHPKNVGRIMACFRKASARTKKTEAIVAEAMQETGFSRKTVYAAFLVTGWSLRSRSSPGVAPQYPGCLQGNLSYGSICRGHS